MTACAIETVTEKGGAPRRPVGLVIAADGSYGARLAPRGELWFPERWTLGGPEPYAVPLPGSRPEEPDSEVLPLVDGRVLIRRRAGERHTFSLLYPTGPETGEVLLGAVDGGPVSLLPPAPGDCGAYALVPGERSTAVWLVAGGGYGPELVARVPGRCSGGVWLDRAGRMLALDQEAERGGRVKSVAVDLGRGGEVSPLLQITEDSDDRLLLADPESGLLLIRSDAPGHDRLGWGVLGSSRPVRFPECLRPADSVMTPFAVQPGQVLTPESCAVALRVDGAWGSWLGVWRPAGRRLHQFAAPEGWLTGAGVWTPSGVLRLPYATASVPCGVERIEIPQDDQEFAAPSGAAATGAVGERRATAPGEERGEETPGPPPSDRPSSPEGAVAEAADAEAAKAGRVTEGSAPYAAVVPQRGTVRTLGTVPDPRTGPAPTSAGTGTGSVANASPGACAGSVTDANASAGTERTGSEATDAAVRPGSAGGDPAPD
ncbi:hypothetical protein, partial [Streptomyces sp. GC420]|uniref:hypothetical protein n=1 Tax=Streptomyces sp. GC420 TaxID=2697568 RepID=UPI0037DA4B5C